MNQDSVTMSQWELQRLPVLEAVNQRQITQRDAARGLGLSPRQVRRLQRRLAREGPPGLAHRSRGRPSTHRVPDAQRRRVITLVREQYGDFGPTLASEQLAQRHHLHVSRETLRRWMRAAGLWAGRRRARPHRMWRERAACYGQLVQMDGSHHAWLEARGPRLVLMGYVDDATGRVYARFYEAEDLPAALDSFHRYSRRYGLPQAVYLDKHTIYRSPKAPTVEEQLRGQVPQSQFERALSELGVAVIHANSPQAKGRVERLFGTLQDRLVKALRLAGITTRAAANRFLRGFLPAYNRRFAGVPRQPGNLHRRLPTGWRLDQILCVKEPRVVANDGTIQIHGHRLQLLPPGLRPLAKRRVTVTISPTQRLQVLDRGHVVAYRRILAPVRAAPPPRRLHRPTAHPAAPTHPWKTTWSARQRHKNRTLLSC